MKKIKVGIVFGGRSSEHEVSIKSAESIFRNLDREKYTPVMVKIGKDGGCDWESLRKVDVVFPIVHGSFGEDGCLQGLLELWNIAYVGTGVLGSAVGMDKDVQKRLLMQAGIPVARYQAIYDLRFMNYELKYPVFVKPANMGSSVGISKVTKKVGLQKAVDEAKKYDNKVLVEEFVPRREIECAVLGDPVIGKVEASVPGEVIPQGHAFYDYEAKYIDEKGAVLEIPAKLSKVKIKEVQQLAIMVFTTLGGEGMGRVDMFIKENGDLVVNEINTLPGFTNISMYPKLWEASGLSYAKLLEKLIELATERKKRQDKLVRSFIFK